MAITTEVFYRIGELIGNNGYLGKVGSIRPNLSRFATETTSLTTTATEALEHLAEIGVPEAIELLSHIPGLLALLG